MTYSIGMRTLLFLLVSFPAFADLTGIVVGVADGDTVTVLDADKAQHKVRVAGIDAPEKSRDDADERAAMIEYSAGLPRSRRSQFHCC